MQKKIENIIIDERKPTSLPEVPKIEISLEIDVTGHGKELFKQVDEIISLDVETDSDCFKVNSVLALMKKGEKDVENYRKLCKRPILDKGTYIDEKLNPFKSEFSGRASKLKAKSQKYNDDKAARELKAREEAEAKQKALDDAAAKKQATNEKISISKGGTGEVSPVVAKKVAMPVAKMDMSGTKTRKSWKATVIFPEDAPKSILRDPRVVEQIRIVAQEMVQKNKKELGKNPKLEDLTDIPGIAVTEEKNVI